MVAKSRHFFGRYTARCAISTVPPKRRFWKTEQEDGRVCSRYFARVRRPNRVLTTVANKKSHFQASVEMGMKNVDNDAVNTRIDLLCYLVVKTSFNLICGELCI